MNGLGAALARRTAKVGSVGREDAAAESQSADQTFL